MTAPPTHEPPPELANNGRAFLLTPFANNAHGHLHACHDMLAHPHTVPGLGDGGAHVSVISDGSFPTTLLARCGRDRPSVRFDLGWLVKRQTADTVRTVGLMDRGVLAPGYRADLNVIDMVSLQVLTAPPGRHCSPTSPA
jgi:N-acyl-D-aspartate/D-glutamate deacylase